ncbi:ABC transporter [Solemya velesiana gill symbiont]|uniref:ABC transporter n=1 Tax=Solemya velesiana gill symbiont TaxID=1918948 RepID=A0A1T2KYL9_9GAMM|nr:ABC transporter [Solemya velesiana gill symbiont]
MASARGLVKDFGRHRAVDGIDFDILRGTCFGFLGPNGAGKTTTLKMLLGLAPKSGGELSVYDLPVPERAREVRARTGLVPQADNLDPDFSVAENLRTYATYFGMKPDDVGDRVERLLAFAALTDRSEAKTDTLSGGMKRRLTIARALINEPEMVVLDEPTTGLDPQARHIIWSRLNELREQGTTLILTTHYMEEVERLCDELVIMDHGRILDQGAPKALVQRHVEPEVIELRGERAGVFADDAQGLGCRVEQMGSSLYCYSHEPGEFLGRLQSATGLTFMHRPTGLEDVFLKLTGRELRD